ncbi:MAG: hypothetical protein H7Z43_02445, partial [Clostridia bacterium]|nr:hypothetical protein [Deltaproteobacteria bacterium]
MSSAPDLQSHLSRLAEAPSDPVALAAVEAAFSGEGRWEELLRVYEDNAQRVNPETSAELLRKAAGVSLRELASATRAQSYLKRAVEVFPSDLQALKELRVVYLAQGDYERGTESYERELTRTTDPTAKAQGLLQLAQIYIESLQRSDKALTALKQAQRAASDNPEVFKLSAQIYELQNKPEQALAALVDELKLTGDEGDIVDRLALLCERLLDRAKLHNGLRTALEKALKARPADDNATRVMMELDSFPTNWTDRAKMFEQRAQEIGLLDKSAAADMWLALAELQLVYGSDNESAMASIDKALAGKPGHPLALKLLEEVYGAEDRYDDLTLKLEMMAAYTRDPQLGVELYLKAAVYHAVRLDSPEAAFRIYDRVLQLDPGNRVASNALVEHYRERKDWPKAIEALSRMAERAATPEDKVAAHHVLSKIYEDELKDPVKARPHYEAVLSLDPSNQGAAKALEQVYRTSNDHSALARALKAKLSGLDGQARLDALAELGDLYAGPLEEPEEALVVLGELYQEKPNAEMRERLEELAASCAIASDATGSAAVTKDSASSTSKGGAFAQLVRVLEGALDRIATDQDRIDALHSLAALYEGARDAPLEALRIHRRILAITPSDERARQALDRLLHAVAETTDKMAFFREQAQAAGTQRERISILKKLAKELVETAKDYARGLDTFREILKLDPEDREAAEGVLAVYRRDNRWAELAEALAYKLEHDGDTKPADDPERVATELDLARVFETHLAQLDRAAERYVEVLRAVPANADALAGAERLVGRVRHPAKLAEVLQPIYVAAAHWSRAAEMIEIRIRDEEDQATRAELLRSLALIYEYRLNRLEDALGTLLRAFQADSGDSGLQVELERVAKKANNFEGVVRLYRAAAMASPKDAKRRLLLRSAMLAEKGNDGTGATRDYLAVIALAEGDAAGTLDGLNRLIAAGLPADELREALDAVTDDLQREGASAKAAGSFWRTLARFFGKVLEKGASENLPKTAVAH